jgi:hypothetical protein
MIRRLFYTISGYRFRLHLPFSMLKFAHSQALVVQIVSKEGKTHLVSIVKGQQLCSLETLPSRSILLFLVLEAEGDEESPWFVFNDFVVRNISEEEALSFPDRWKVRRPSMRFVDCLSDRRTISPRFLLSCTWNGLICGTHSISVVYQTRLIHPFLAATLRYRCQSHFLERRFSPSSFLV